MNGQSYEAELQSLNVDEILDQDRLDPIALDEASIKKQLSSKSLEVKLPYLNTQKLFSVKEFSIYGKEKNPYPEIKTYKLYDNSTNALAGRITSGPAGISIIYLKNGRMIRIYKSNPTDLKSKDYVQEIGISELDRSLYSCENHPELGIENQEIEIEDPIDFDSKILKRNGSTKRVYRAAIMCTGEYFVANGGGATAIRQLMISNLNDISAIFENEVAVEMYMAVGSPRLQQDVNNDPFDPSFGSRTAQAQNAISNAFPIARYDVGHVFHNHSSGDGWDTGGVAALGAVCADNRKASGWSGSFNNTSNGWIQLAAHEFGHMYDATHTFNGSGDANCTPNISGVSNYEIGSGTTIMSYNGLCDADQNIPGSGVADNYFHANSLERMVDFLETRATCNQTDWIMDNNNEPVSIANPCGAVYNLPRSTPFMLKGEGTDIDGDMLTYCWEQYDEDGPGVPTIGLIGVAAGSNATCPLYRSFPPTPEPVRYIPNLSDLSNNIRSDFEVLPRRNRSIRFRLTVRDNNPNGGGIDWNDVVIQANVTGPLSVNSPIGGEVIQAGTSVSINWNTGGSEQHCEKAIIRLSTDGGLSFPLVIADDVDYASGTAEVLIPASFPNTEEARIMVACDDYECFAFFDINNNNFTIESNCFAPSNLLCDTQEEVFDFADSGLNLDLEAMHGTNITSLLGPMPDFSTLESMSPAVNNDNGTCTRINTIDNPFLEIPFYVTASGTYVFNIDNSINDNVTAYTIFEADNFNPSDACSSFIESNASFINSSYSFSTNFNTELEACKQYILAAQVTSSSSQNLAISNITGPGSLLRSQDISDYELTFIAVDRNTDLISFQSPEADFRTLAVGEYDIRSAYFKNSGVEPPPNVDPDLWIGMTVDELLAGADCFSTSLNEKPLTVLQSCFVYDIVAENQTACSPETNTYEQTISFKIDMGPGTGTVTINGQTFPLDGDEATVTLTDLVATGRPVDLQFEFSDDIGCDGLYEDVFVSAPNCCPIDIDLGGDSLLCAGEILMLDAGDEAIAYQWYFNGELLPDDGQFLEVIESGTYRAQVTHTSGCINEDEIEAIFEELPDIELDRTEILACQGDLVVINADISINNPTIQWIRNGELLGNMGSSLEVTESGTYEIIVSTENGCSENQSIVADFADSPTPNLGPDILTCNGSITTLDAGTSAADYEWRRNAFPISGDEITIDINTFGTYSVVATNANGCIGLDTIEVDYEPLPEFDFGRDVTRCFGNFYTIEAEPSVFEIQWYKDGELIPGETDIEYIPMESGEFVGEIFVNDQCIESDTILVNYLDVPNVDFPETISACPGEVVELIVDDMNAVFTWSSEEAGTLPETGNTLSVTESGTYYIEARSTATFCIIRDTIAVMFTDIPQLDLGDDQAACEGETITISSPSNGFPVEWYKDGERIMGFSADALDVTEAGEYVIRIDSGQDCVTSDTINVSFFDAPIVDLGEDMAACPGEIIILNGGDASNTFEWSRDGIILSDTGNTLEVNESGTYSVISTNAGDCSSRDTIIINFSDLPVLEFERNVRRCEDDIYTISTNAQGFSVDWYFNGELIDDINDPSLVADNSGEYIAIISGGSNCSVSDTTDVFYSSYPSIDLGPDQSACPGDVIVLELEDMNNTFTWSAEGLGSLANDTNILEVTVSDIYYLEVANEDGCTSFDTIEISFVDLPILDLGSDVELCEGETLVLSNSSNGFNIEWSVDGTVIQAANEESLEINSSGEYTMTVSANQDCKVSDSVIVQFFDLPIANLGEDRSACPGEIITLEAGEASDEIQWSSESMGVLMETSPQLEVTTSDTYYVRVINSAQCISLDTVTITFTDLPDIDLGADISNLCEGDIYTLSIQAAGFDIEWQKDGEVLADEKEESLQLMESGTYSVIVSSGDNCSVRDDITIQFQELPILNTLQNEVACSGESVDLVAGQDGVYRYIWSNEMGVIKDGSEGGLTVNTTGTYTVEAIDDNDCSSIKMVQIEFIDAPIVDLEDSLEFCEGESQKIIASSNVSVIEWYYNGVLIQGQISTELEVSEAGEYIAVVGPGTQCEDRDTITVELISAPVISILSDSQICADQLPYNIEVDIDQNANLQWYEAGQPIAGETSTTFEINQGGSYLVIATNSQACESMSEISVIVYDLPEIELLSVPQLCAGDEFTMTAQSDGKRFEWIKDGELISGANELALDINETGSYEFISYNEIDCQSSESFDVVFDPLPDADLGDDNISACLGESVLLETASEAGTSYTWFYNGNELQGETGNSISVSDPGSYSVELLNSFGCVSTDDINLEFFTPPTLEIDDNAAFCEGGSINLFVNTNASLISWERAGQLLAQNTNTLIVSQAGNYLVSVESADGCMLSQSIVVTENPNPDISLDDIELCPGETQTIMLNPGFAAYNWTGINANGSTADISHNNTDVFSTQDIAVTVVDNNGCSTEAEATISYNPVLDASILSDRVNICIGESAELEVNGGLYYEWSDPGSSLSATDVSNPVASPSTTTSYSVSVTDDCPNNFASFDIEVIVNPLPNVDAGSDTCTIAGADITLTASGAQQYIWNNTEFIIGSSNRASITVNIPADTTFTVTAIDDNGCQAEDSVRVCVLDDPFAVLTAVTLITPNADGRNDVLEFNGLDAFPQNKLTVMNRWGNVIYSKTGYQNDGQRWDGTRDGEALPADTYYYILEFSNFTIKKSITLLRD